MSWAVTADPDRFDEAVDWFDDRFPLTEALKERLGEFAGPRAWTVAGVAQLDIILDVFVSLQRAIEAGTTLADWKREVRDKLERSWGRKDSARLETIFRTNVQTAYNRGRWLQMKDPAVAEARPFWMYDAILDGRTTTICSARNKTVLPQDDSWWDSNVPPLHHRCRSSLRALTREQAKRRGISPSPPDAEEPDEGFGTAPEEDEWRPDPSKYPPELWAIFEQKQQRA